MRSTGAATRVALLGLGEIGRSVLAAWPPCHGRFELVAIGVRPGTAPQRREDVPLGIPVFDSVDELKAFQPDIVIEAAGQQAAEYYLPILLDAGIDVHLLSVGILGKRDFLTALSLLPGRLMLPAGALAGFDGLRSMRKNDLQSVCYRSVKPPMAWRRTDAERLVDLDALSSATIFFTGTAREATLRFPQNANLAAAVALAGIGLDRTMVELVADPAATQNIGELTARTATETLEVRLAGQGFAGNPKSSRLTGLSVLAALENDNAPLVFV